jgi:hypothetical protein
VVNKKTSCFSFLYIFYFSGSKPLAPVVHQEQQDEEEQQQQQPEISTRLPSISHEHVFNHPPSTKSTIPKRVRQPTYGNINRWNTSTHVKPNAYVPDLADAYRLLQSI